MSWMAALAQNSISQYSTTLHEVSADPSDGYLKNPSASVAATVAAAVHAEVSPNVSPCTSANRSFHRVVLRPIRTARRPAIGFHFLRSGKHYNHFHYNYSAEVYSFGIIISSLVLSPTETTSA